MRVLRLSHSATVAAWRGRERALRTRGVDVTLLAARDWHAGGSAAHLGAHDEADTIPVRTWGRHPALFVYDPRPIWRALGGEWDLIDIHEEPFALATAEVLLLRALRRQRAPFVLYTAQNLRKRYPVPFRWWERHALLRASGISACNAEAAMITVEKGFPGRPNVIPLGVDLDAFAPGPARVVDGEAVMVGMLGRVVAEKGVDVLVDALLRDGRLRARIGGSGPATAALESRIVSEGLSVRVELVGAVAPDRVADFYRSVDVVAVPSLPTATWTEQFGRVAVEAMACGVPVVSSDAGALPDIVGGAGLVVPHGDAGALAQALHEAATTRRDELRSAGSARADGCSWDAVADRYLDLYRGVLHAAAPSPRPLEVVVVAYRTPDLLRTALEPLGDLPVTVVDNSSMPEIAAVCAEFGARYVDAGANRGFASGVNIGLTHVADDADVLLLNPDARIDRSQIKVLELALVADPRLASVGPVQVNEHGRRTQVEWVFPSPANSVLEAVGLSRLQRGERFVIGSVLLLRREALRQVGGFDENFFLYAEETDWAYRAHRLGWIHRSIPTAIAMHRGAGTSSDSAVRETHFFASQERYYRKHFGAVGWFVARAAAWAGATARSIVWRDERAVAARQRAALYRRGPLRAERMLGGAA